jgi:hypothetical protein
MRSDVKKSKKEMEMTTTLKEIIDKQQQIESACSFRTCRADELKFHQQQVIIGNVSFRLAEACIEKDIPNAFDINRHAFSRLTKPQRIALISFEQQQKPDRMMNFTVNNENTLLALNGEKETMPKPSEILGEILDSVPDGVVAKDFPARWNAQPSPTQIECTIISTHVQREVKVGDIICAGLNIIYPGHDGGFLPDIHFFVERLCCLNGLRITENRDPMQDLRRHLREWRLPQQVVLSEMRRCFGRAWEMAGFPLDMMESLQNQPVDDPLLAIDALSQRLGLSDQLRRQVMQAYQEDELGENPTRLGVLNAFTRLSSHGAVSPGSRARLVRAAQRILRTNANQCPACRAFFVNPN